MTINQILASAIKKLEKNNIKNPHLEAELLLSSILKKEREFILSHPKYKLNLLQITNYKLQIFRRISGTPLAYLTHSKGFYGRDFYVDKNVLIPRPETEIMIDEVLNNKLKEKEVFIDIGTGSGCIIISLIKELQNSQFKIKNSQFYAIDVSKKALKIARRNAKTYKVNNIIQFHHGNLLAPILNLKFQILNSKFKIFANLPYLNPSQMNHPNIQKEPKIALEAGFDGLKYYRELLPQVAKLKIKNEKSRIIIYLEIDDSQKRLIKDLIKNELPNAKCKIKTDLRGKSRLVILNI